MARRRPNPRRGPSHVIRDAVWRQRAAFARRRSRPRSDVLRARLFGIGPRSTRARVVAVLLTVVVLDVLWLGGRALLARHHLNQARTLAAQAQQEVVQGHLQDALQSLSRVRGQSAAAVGDTSDPLWRANASLPGVGRSLSTVSGLAAAVDDVAARVLPQLTGAVQDIRGSNLRRPDGSLRVSAISAAGAGLATADSALAASRARVEALPSGGLLPPVATARRQLLELLDSLSQQFKGASIATALAPAMLGGSGPREYFLALENTAESRGTGGIIGGFARIQVSDGKLNLVDAGGDGKLPDYGEPVTTLPADFTDRWQTTFGAAQIWRNANLSPHFPFAVQILAALSKRHFGVEPDGVIALDPTAAGYLVGATGPITLPDGTMLTKDNLTKYVESDLYTTFSDRTTRQYALADVTKAIFAAISAGKGDPGALLAALARADGEGRLLLGSTHPEEEKTIASVLAGGSMETGPGPYSSLVVTNAGGDKLDYYLDRAVTWTAGACTPRGRRSTVEATLTNAAPATGLPDYVSGAATINRSVPPYVLRDFVSLYATPGATLLDATLDGRPVVTVTAVERGHPVVSLYVDLPPAGGSARLVVHWQEPSAAGAPKLRVQPLVRDQTSRVDVPTC